MSTSGSTVIRTAIDLQFGAPNVIRMRDVNNDDVEEPRPDNPTPAPVEDADATVTFTLFDRGGTPFPDYTNVPMPWVPAVDDEPACYKASLPAVTSVPPGQYYGQMLVSVAGYDPQPFRLVVTVYR